MTSIMENKTQYTFAEFSEKPDTLLWLSLPLEIRFLIIAGFPLFFATCSFFVFQAYLVYNNAIFARHICQTAPKFFSSHYITVITFTVVYIITTLNLPYPCVTRIFFIPTCAIKWPVVLLMEYEKGNCIFYLNYLFQCIQQQKYRWQDLARENGSFQKYVCFAFNIFARTFVNRRWDVLSRKHPTFLILLATWGCDCILNPETLLGFWKIEICFVCCGRTGKEHCKHIIRFVEVFSCVTSFNAR